MSKFCGPIRVRLSGRASVQDQAYACLGATTEDRDMNTRAVKLKPPLLHALATLPLPPLPTTLSFTAFLNSHTSILYIAYSLLLWFWLYDKVTFVCPRSTPLLLNCDILADLALER